ncbi:MAG: hypothetical protein HYV00_08275 [Deltaproteobacteria bacterium]|nr:hypothetical protein [Deltaproteobacteria bacterium]
MRTTVVLRDDLVKKAFGPNNPERFAEYLFGRLDSPAQPKRTEGSIGGGVSFRALCDQVRTIDKGRIRETVGVLSGELLGKMDRGLILHLELEDYVKL